MPGGAEHPKERARFVREEASQIGLGAANELPPAAASRLHVHGDARAGQRLQVAACGGQGHLKFVSEFGSGDASSRLQKQHGCDESVGAHDMTLSRKVLNR